jgi:hypothetical protein
VKRIGRILLHLATAISLLIFVAAVTFWVRGYFVSDKFYYSRWQVGDHRAKEAAYWFLSSRGQVGIAQRLQDIQYDPPDLGQNLSVFLPREERYWRSESPPALIQDAPNLPSLFHPLGFSYTNQPMSPQMAVGGFRQWLVPLWFICLITAPLPAFRLARLRRRYPPGHCPRCRYDLRATPHQCPECGHEMRSKA